MGSMHVGGDRNAAEPSALEGVDAPISAWAADQCGKSLGRELLPEEDWEHVAQVRAAKGRELSAWRKFKASAPAKNGAPFQAVADVRWAPTWKIADGKRVRRRAWRRRASGTRIWRRVWRKSRAA